jgi:hypothetical protein
MTEPTIDEMLEWLKYPRVEQMSRKVVIAIRAILEQHRDSSIDAIRAVISEERGRDLLIVRAFVDRVEKRPEHWKAAIMNELAAMEKEDE